MNLLHIIIFSIVEGITEFLPISSTGHLIITARLLGLEQNEFLKSFEIVIQLGAISAVIFLYWRTLAHDWNTVKRVALAFLPTGLAGFALYPIIKHYFLGNASLVLWSLLLGGIFLIFFEKWQWGRTATTEELSQISYRQALWVGVSQIAAMIPGVSRAAATIVGGLMQGLSRKTIVEFSFLLAVPTMLAATGLDLLKNAQYFLPEQFFAMAIGFFLSFFAALGTVTWLLQFIKNHSFEWFGWYRIVAACLGLLFL